jgi:CMP-N,N'-diacetyllegionaminic acid synthase
MGQTLNQGEKKILITLCARGGSKGIPGKNIKPVNGIPLIAYSINVAKQFAEKFNSVITLSTDSEEIKKVAKEFGVDTRYIRPEEYSRDETGKIDTIRHLLDFEQELSGDVYDYVLDLDITSPLRNLKDLVESYKIILNDENCLNLISVSKAHRNPYFNMVEKKENGYYYLVKEGLFKTRQSAPPVYDLNASFYFYTKEFFEDKYATAITKRTQVYLVPHMCFDLDHPVDFEFMEFLIKNRKLDFDL